jgi:uncharacterized protein YodC (DUF2158 family)
MAAAPVGAIRLVKFGAAMQITQSLNFQVLTGASIQARVNDTAVMQSVGSAQWQMIDYQRGDGTPLVSVATPDNTKLPLAGGKMSGPIKDADIQTVTTVTTGDIDVSTITSQTVRITGTSPVSTLTNPPAGSGFEIRFLFADAGIVINHLGGNIQTPGSTNIVTQAGDTMTVLQTTSPGIWRCVDYQRADGTSLVGSPDASKVPLTAVGAANGVAPLGSDSKIAAAYLPSYVDDVLEYANFAAFPATGESGKIYIAADTSREYRWSGSVYTAIVASPGTTDNVPEGTTNLYFTAARVLATALSGLSLLTGSAVVATDSILVAIGKLQAQNTAQDTAISGKEPTITAGSAGQYWNGLKAFTDFATSVRAAALTGLSLATNSAITATDTVLTALGKLQAQLNASVSRTETIATTSVGQTSYSVPNGYVVGAISVFMNGVLLAPADYTATDGTNIVLASGALTTSDIMSVLVIGSVRAQDDALLSYTVAQLNTMGAAANARKVRWCSDVSGGPQMVVSNGTNWVRVQDLTVVTT